MESGVVVIAIILNFVDSFSIKSHLSVPIVVVTFAVVLYTIGICSHSVGQTVVDSDGGFLDRFD